MKDIIYKICPRDAWEQAVLTGVYEGAPIDAEDGFIHFSAAHQVAETAAKHFAGQSDLVLVAVNACELGDALRWEPSRGGELFPHLYGTLNVSTVRSTTPLPVGPDGSHMFPDGVPT
ncbi:MAG: DUF952 domain-containing protein [Hyphomicrobiaceae bacterium]|nr:DUF952 domain-containing protein [Hyphomicrobiaceae bacterium]